MGIFMALTENQEKRLEYLKSLRGLAGTSLDGQSASYDQLQVEKEIRELERLSSPSNRPRVVRCNMSGAW